MNLLFVLALLLVFWLLYKQYLSKILQQGTPGKIKVALIALGIVFLLMAVTGRAPALFALLGAAMTQIFRLAPLVIRFAPLLKKVFDQTASGHANAGARSRVSQVKTPTIDMTLDHGTNQMDGLIKAGPSAGSHLSQLSMEQLKQLVDYCQQHDQEALRLLEAYVAQERNGEWGYSGGGEHASDARHDRGKTEMSVEEAREILGLTVEASREEIVAAHRQLMRRLHPDKGGSNYLAAKVNAAKDLLLKML